MTLKVDVSYGGLFRLAVMVISVAMVIYHVWAIAFGSPEAFHYRGTHLLFAMTLVFLLYRSSGKAEGLPTPLDYLLLASLGARFGDLLVTPVKVGEHVIAMFAASKPAGVRLDGFDKIAEATGAAFARLMRDVSR